MAEQPAPKAPEDNEVIKPGDTITPAGMPRPVEARFTTLDPVTHQPLTEAPDATAAPVIEPLQTPEPVEPPAAAPVASPSNDARPNPAPHAADNSATPTELDEHVQVAADGTLTWTILEFGATNKSTSWYAALAGVSVMAAIIVYLLIKDMISSVVVLVCGFVFGFYGSRKPKLLTFMLNDHGIATGEKFHPYHDFRSFAVTVDGPYTSILLHPLKRFALYLTVNCHPDDEDRIIDVLAARLPFEDHSPDPIDRLMSRIRF